MINFVSLIFFPFFFIIKKVIIKKSFHLLFIFLSINSHRFHHTLPPESISGNEALIVLFSFSSSHLSLSFSIINLLWLWFVAVVKGDDRTETLNLDLREPYLLHQRWQQDLLRWNRYQNPGSNPKTMIDKSPLSWISLIWFWHDLVPLLISLFFPRSPCVVNLVFLHQQKHNQTTSNRKRLTQKRNEKKNWWTRRGGRRHVISDESH